MTTDVLSKFQALEQTLNDELYERRDPIHTAVLALLARKHHFQIGPPGVAKSLLVTRLVKRIDGMEGKDFFHWLLTQYTTPEELYGAIDLPLYKEKGIFRRLTLNKLPEAKIVFLDEFFKGNSAILNANLTAMNERKFFNNDPEHEDIPVLTFFTASNEMPPGDETNALWDRVHFRLDVREMQESSSFVNMLTGSLDKDPEKVIHIDDLYTAHELVDRVELPKDVLDALRGLRESMKDANLIVSDRRWNECLPIIQAEAFMRGRERAEIADMRPLMFVLWSNHDNQKVVTRLVLDLANPIDREALDILDNLNALETQFRRDIADAENEKEKSKLAIEVHAKLKKTRTRLIELKKAADESGRPAESLRDVKKKFVAVGRLLSEQGFGVESNSSFLE